MANKPVFFDATGRRAFRVSLIGWGAAIVSTLLGVAFLTSVAAVPHFASVKLPGRLTAVNAQTLEQNALAPGLLHSAAQLAAQARAKRIELLKAKHLRNARIARAHKMSLLHPKGRPLAIAFYPDWEGTAYDELKSALPQLDWVIPTWLSLQGPDLTLKNSFNPRVLQYIRHTKPNVVVLPVIQNSTLGKWDGPGLAKMLADPARRASLIASLASFIDDQKLQGITIDFEEVPPGAQADLGSFLKELHAALAPHNWLVVQAAPFADDKWPFAQYARNIDYTMLMAYDEHGRSAAGGAGSIAGQPWYENLLDKRMRVLKASHTIIAIGGYGYDFNGDDVDSVSYEEAVIDAHDSGAEIVFDDATNNPHFSYIEDDDTEHDIWFLDGVTAYNEIHAADPYQPAGYALWRLGSEDPSVFTVLGRPYGAPAPDALQNIPIIEDIDYEGQGEILRVVADPTPGLRTFELDAQTGDIDDETYTKLPTGYVIRQFGAAGKEIALTFDDGPDPEWTPQVLDILKREHVHATFFIIGGNAEANPNVVQRELAEGHEIGNHTFTHPDLADTPVEAVTLELNATQRLFEALTGRSLRLFRPPYLGDAEPTDDDEIIPVEVAQNMGYITVGEHVDPVDWTLPGAGKIVKDALAQIYAVKSDMPRNIVLLHDAGGDRSQTIAALPILIEKLKAEGYKFVPVSQLAGLTPDQAMPPLPPTIALLTDRVVFMAISLSGHVLYIMFLAAIWLGIGRLLFLAGLSLWNRRREDEDLAPPPAEERFAVSVIIPAYNEESVIATTVKQILASTYRNLHVIVVDDGSQDRTSAVMQEKFASDPRVETIRIANGGKAHALNMGLANATGDVIVALDADTQFDRDTIARLVRWFADREYRRSRGQCQGRQPHQHDHALAGAGIYRGAESGAPRACSPRHAHRRSRRRRRMAQKRASGAWRFSGRHAGRGSGPHHRHPEGGLSREVRFIGDCLDRSAAHRARARQAAFPLGLWHAAMSVEISRHHLQRALRHAGLDRAAAGVAVPDRADGTRPAGRSASHLAIGVAGRGLSGARRGIHQQRSHHSSASITSSSSSSICWRPCSASSWNGAKTGACSGG